MAPRETTKVTPKPQRLLVKTSETKKKTVPVTSIKKTTMSSKKTVAVENDSKSTKPTVEMRQRTNTVPKLVLPKETKSVPLTGSVTKSAKKGTWNRRPKPAHSGVPVPEKMKKLLQKRLQDFDCSL